MPPIENTDALASFCERLSEQPYVAVDTEFMRESTYWSRLCLIQVATSQEAAAIDPLANGIDLTPLYDLLIAPNIVKVFHAARQDLEIFHHDRSIVPAPLFDTQIAAMVCGFGDSVGYEKLAGKLAGAKIDKSSQFTDWSRRPLSKRQIDYALSDVTHLCLVYEKLHARLRKSGRERWLDEEMAVLANPETYAAHPEDAWRRIKTRNRGGRFLALLKELAAWRDLEAQGRDKPRNRILRDEVLLAIAADAPRTMDDLKRVRSFPKNYAERPEAQAILAAVARGAAIKDDALPNPEARKALPRGAGPLVELLRVLLKMKSDHHDVAQKLVASAEDLERIALGNGVVDVPALHGWRRELFGEDALALKRGELALAVSGGRLTLVSTQQQREA